MPKYCCFFCPANDYADKALSDQCPVCGRTYAFPLDFPPSPIREFHIKSALGRGFYGATYVAERGPFRKPVVLKITPQSFYSFFPKPAFQEEASAHAKVAANATHVVGIDDAFEALLSFADPERTVLPCYVTVLGFIDGQPLRAYLDGFLPVTASGVCQIVIDLLRLRVEFERHQVNHNDLHAENLIVQRLPPDAFRADAIDGSLRVMAIDLGSVSNDSKSGPRRLGDQHFIAEHVSALLDRLLSEARELNDRDYRIALNLQGLISSLRLPSVNSRVPNAEDLIAQVRDSYLSATQPWHPWRRPGRLNAFDDHYNALTMESWDVPQLLVDPKGEWLVEISRPGPQIITGMRGCGKTMLLRALDIHARLSPRDGEALEKAANRVRDDQFVGLFVSAQRLLELRPQSLAPLEHRLARLFVSYGLEAARALLHVRDVAPDTIAPTAHSLLGTALADFLDGAGSLHQASSLDDLERRLTGFLVALSTEGYLVKAAPAVMFVHLARVLQRCATIFAGCRVFYLLDDVSTRYMELPRVEELLSASSLLFQDPVCAFKFSSEWQTIELGLKSPGLEHPVREGRDLTVFDLGANVLQTMSAVGGHGKEFVAQILAQRAAVHVSHPRNRSPKDLLGDVPLEQVAREIAGSSDTSSSRKRIYRGLTCLANVCVGDIGDVIKIYEGMLRRGVSEGAPISASVQCEVFERFSVQRLYDLNRRKGYFKDHALAFARAAHELLVRSGRDGEGDHPGKTLRLRQYSSVYVRVTSDDEGRRRQQIDRLRELIDAGVFVFAGGAPRSKTRDSNPIQQFFLAYRKIYGLTAFIGLADRDRFELSGPDLEEWLDSPADATEILLRNQIEDEMDARSESAGDVEAREKPSEELPSVPSRMDSGSSVIEKTEPARPWQASLFDGEPPRRRRAVAMSAKRIGVEIEMVDQNTLGTLSIGTVVSALGFEERTLASNTYLSAVSRPKQVVAVRYSLNGLMGEIRETWSRAGKTLEEIPYSDRSISVAPFEGLGLIDVTGLAKPAIFSLVRRELYEKGRVLVCHASAELNFPLHADLERVLEAEKSGAPDALLESLAGVLAGEKGPYDAVRLLDERSDPSRRRALLAFASPKHERLFSLLDRREYDYIEVIAPAADTPRARVAKYVAQFACQNYPNTRLVRIDTDDLVGLVRHMDEQYLSAYGAAGGNLEIGLTGSKMQAVAAAILASQRRVSQVWYVSPREFDEMRFSKGVRQIRVFDISVRNDDLRRIAS